VEWEEWALEDSDTGMKDSDINLFYLYKFARQGSFPISCYDL